MEEKNKITGSLNDFLRQAFEFVEHQEYDKAENIFKQILQQTPDQPNSLFGLGSIAFQQNDRNEAKRLFKNVLEKSKDHRSSLEYLALIFFDEGNWLEAQKYIDRLSIIDPTNASHQKNLGFVLSKLNKTQESITCYEKAVSLNPDSVDFLLQLGNIYYFSNQLEKSKSCYDRALALKPDCTECLINIGNIYYSVMQLEEAKNYFESALKIEPHNDICLSNLGVIAQEQGDLTKAKEYYDNAIKINPNYQECLINLGNLFLKEKEYEKAKGFYARVIAINPNNVDALINLGNIARARHSLSEAKKYYEQSLAIRPNSAISLANLGTIYHEEGDFTREQHCYDKAMEIYKAGPPVNANKLDFAIGYETLKLNLGILQLLKTNFKDGFENYQSRKIVLNVGLPIIEDTPIWDGTQDLQDKELLILHEQGYGDYIQFIRFSESLKKKGAYLHAITIPRLKSTIESVPWIDEVSDSIHIKKKKESYQVSVMDLAKCLKIEPNDIPNSVPYIFSEKKKIKKMRSILKTNKKINVGISWTGRIDHENDRNRSIEFKILLPLLKVKKVQFYSLVVDDKKKEMAPFKKYIIDMKNNIKDFSDTAALIENLDLVISVDTAVAHLAGAMNKPCWLLLPKVPDWRWQLNREDSPWYPSLRLFRKTQKDQWDDVIEQLLTELTKMAS